MDPRLTNLGNDELERILLICELIINEIQPALKVLRYHYYQHYIIKFTHNGSDSGKTLCDMVFDILLTTILYFVN